MTCYFKIKKFLSRKYVIPFLTVIGILGFIGAMVYFPLIRYSGQWIGGANTYPTVFISFLDFPFWHQTEWIQKIRIAGNSVLDRESSMAYLGLAAIVLLVWGIFQKPLRNKRLFFWFWILVISGILSLGSWLHLTHETNFNIPLPYIVFEAIPFLSTFRVPGRILMTTTLASSMLSVLVLTELLKNKKRIFQYGLVLCLILFTALEFDLFNLGKGTVSRNLSNAYEYIKNDTDNFAILELPSAYSETGDMGYLGNYYMFRQTQHGHSMVLGAPSRFLSQSLDFTNDTPVFYEFTHPWIFKRLENDKKLANIAQFITENGADLVRKNGIKYVLHHTRNNYFDEETKANTTEWLNKIYGDPILIDGEGINLYAVKSGG